MSEVNNEMVRAGLDTTMTGTDGRTVRESLGPWTMRAAIEAALASAPTVEDVVWCNEWKKIYGRTSAGIYRCESFVGLAVPGVCPGPHRTLLLGPEVAP
jgi:surface antigen